MAYDDRTRPHQIRPTDGDGAAVLSGLPYGLQVADGGPYGTEVDGLVPVVGGLTSDDHSVTIVHNGDGTLDLAASAGGVGGTFNPDAGRSPWLAPYGVRIRGVNIDAKIYMSGGTELPAWGNMFGEWDAIWPTYIKPQIDAVASIGANAIRMMGAAPSVITGYCTEAQYLDGYEQLVDYCATQGLWVYACLSASQEWNGESVADVMPVMEAQAAMLDGKPNVIAIDVCQEIGLTSGFIPSTSIHDAADQLVTPIRAVTTLPLTCSVTATNNTSGASQFAATHITTYDDLFDFFDFHPYYNGMTVADVATAANAAAAVGKVILFGEYGATDTNYTRYEAVATVTEGTPNLVGSFAWAATDRMGGSSGEYGLFAEPGFTPRTALVTAFQKIPDHFHAKHSGHHLHDDGTRLPARSRLDFVGAGVTATDDATNDTTTVTIPGAGLTVQDENGTIATGVTQIDFQGSAITAATGTGEVVVTVAGASGFTHREVAMADFGSGLEPVVDASGDWLYGTYAGV